MFDYNGIYCEIVDVPRIVRQAQYTPDGVDYLWTHYVMDFLLLFHRSYVNATATRSDPAASPLNQTDVFLRYQLLQPRQKFKLIFLNSKNFTAQADLQAASPFQDNSQDRVQESSVEFSDPYRSDTTAQVMQNAPLSTLEPTQTANAGNVGGGATSDYEIYIESPLRGEYVDSNNGPHPISCDIVDIKGSNAFVIRYSIETWLNEMGAPYDNYFSSNQAAMLSLLSHRFNSIHDVDSDGFTTKITQGEAYFRTDLMEQYSITPDMLRNYLFVPIAPTMKRESIRVEQPSEGNILRYQIVDQEKPINLNGNLLNQANCGAMRVQVNKAQIYGTADSIESSFFRFGEQFFSIRNSQEWFAQAKRDREAAEKAASRPKRGEETSESSPAKSPSQKPGG